MARPRLGLGQADLRQFRIGIGGAGNMGHAGAGRQREQHLPDDHPGMIARKMRELRAPRRIAHGVDAPVGRPQAGIDGHAPCVMGHPGNVQPQPVQRNLAPGGNQDVRAGHSSAIRQRGGDAGAARNGADTGAFDNRHPFRAQLLHCHGGQFGVFPAKRAAGFDHRHRAAQTAMRLRHLQPDRPAPQDQQVRWLLAQGKDRFIGQIRQVRQAGNRRHDRA